MRQDQKTQEKKARIRCNIRREAERLEEKRSDTNGGYLQKWRWLEYELLKMKEEELRRHRTGTRNKKMHGITKTSNVTMLMNDKRHDDR